MARIPDCRSASSSASGNAASASPLVASCCIHGTRSATRAASSGSPPSCENVHGALLSRSHTRSGSPTCSSKWSGMLDLAWQFAEPHAAARQERAGRFDTGPGSSEISLAEHAIQEARRYPKIDGEFRRQRLPPPGSPDPAAKVVATIRVHGGLDLLVGKFILLLHAATDRVGHAARRTTDRASQTPTPRQTDHDGSVRRCGRARERMRDPRRTAVQACHLPDGMQRVLPPGSRPPLRYGEAEDLRDQDRADPLFDRAVQSTGIPAHHRPGGGSG